MMGPAGWIVSNLLVACLLAAIAWWVGRSGRRAGWAHTLWVLVLLKMVTPPVYVVAVPLPTSWTWTFTQNNVTDEHIVHGNGTDGKPNKLVTQRVSGVPSRMPRSRVGLRFSEAMRIGSGSPGVTEITSIPTPTVAQTLMAIWAAGASIILIRGGWRWFQFSRLLDREGSLDLEATDRVKHWLRRGRAPAVVRVPVRVSPMLFGLGRRPRIVCSHSLWRELGDTQRNAFLAHEAAHYHRRDHWVRALEWVVTCVYWWLPPVRWVRSQIQRHEEVCCDAWAIDRLALPPRRYAESLLAVVDFISDHRVGIPAMASGMRPGAELEERLRLMMRPGGRQLHHPRWAIAPAAMLILSLHPTAGASRWLQPPTSQNATAQRSAMQSNNTAAAVGALSQNEVELPPAAPGYWNQKPPLQYANEPLSGSDAVVLATAGRGVAVVDVPSDPVVFADGQMTAMTEVAATGRLLIGDAAGQIKLWDIPDAAAVSLIGQHAAAITTLSLHPAGGLIAGDAAGSVIRWDRSSGRAIATWSTPRSAPRSPARSTARPIQSIRHNATGDSVAILTGQWNQDPTYQTFHLLQTSTLRELRSTPIPSGVAVVAIASDPLLRDLVAAPGVKPSPPGDWVAVDWTGVVWSPQRLTVLGQIPKKTVSAMVLIDLPQTEKSP